MPLNVSRTDDSNAPILLYDGVCVLCNRLNQFVLRRDRRAVFRFAALQSSFAREILRRHGRNSEKLETLYVVTKQATPRERLLARSRAVIYVLAALGGWWRSALVLRVIPPFLLDIFYQIVARNRYRLFGRQQHCILPRPEWRDRFIESA